MLGPNHKKTIIACVALLVMALAITAFTKTSDPKPEPQNQQGTESTNTGNSAIESKAEQWLQVSAH